MEDGARTNRNLPCISAHPGFILPNFLQKERAPERTTDVMRPGAQEPKAPRGQGLTRNSPGDGRRCCRDGGRRNRSRRGQDHRRRGHRR